MSPLGTHHILELHDCPSRTLDDLDAVLDALTRAAAAAKSTLLTLSHHRFEPAGVTGIALLAESHISIHTWPELGYAAADVFTCGTHTTPDLACEEIVKRLRARRHVLRVVPRGHLPASISPVRTPIVANG